MFKKMKQGLSQLSQKSTWLPSIVIVLVAVLLLLPQLTSRGVIAGSDFYFTTIVFMRQLCKLRRVTLVILCHCMAFTVQDELLMLCMARTLLIFKEFWYSSAKTGIPINFCHVSC